MRIGCSAKGPVGRDVEREGATAIERGDKHADGVGRRGAHELGCRREGRLFLGQDLRDNRGHVFCHGASFFETTVVRIDAGHAAGRRAVKATRLARIWSLFLRRWYYLVFLSYTRQIEYHTRSHGDGEKTDYFVAGLVFRA